MHRSAARPRRPACTAAPGCWRHPRRATNVCISKLALRMNSVLLARANGPLKQALIDKDAVRRGRLYAPVLCAFDVLVVNAMSLHSVAGRFSRSATPSRRARCGRRSAWSGEAPEDAGLVVNSCMAATGDSHSHCDHLSTRRTYAAHAPARRIFAAAKLGPTPWSIVGPVGVIIVKGLFKWHIPADEQELFNAWCKLANPSVGRGRRGS